MKHATAGSVQEPAEFMFHQKGNPAKSNDFAGLLVREKRFLAVPGVFFHRFDFRLSANRVASAFVFISSFPFLFRMHNPSAAGGRAGHFYIGSTLKYLKWNAFYDFHIKTPFQKTDIVSRAAFSPAIKPEFTAQVSSVRGPSTPLVYHVEAASPTA